MNLTSIDHSTNALSGLPLEKTLAAADTEAPVAGSDFGAVMNTLLARQVLPSVLNTPSGVGTDPLLSPEAMSEKALLEPQATGLTPGSAGESVLLTAFHLGPHLQVITPQTAAPEGQSLEMFARSQGLDEAALQWLMGTPSVANAPSGQPMMGAMASEKPSWLLPSPPTGAEGGVGPSPVTTAAAGSSLDLQNLSSPWAAALAKNGTGGAVPATDLKGQAVGAPTTDTSPIDIKVLKFDPLTDPVQTGPAWAAGTATASEWLKNNTLALHSLPTPALQPGSVGKVEQALKSLDLSLPVSAELRTILDHLNAADGTSGQESNPQGQGSFHSRSDLTALGRTESSAPSSALPEMDSAQRRDMLQNLAEKMGQAVGQRMLSEMERGHWHLKLSLRPATLGHIEVEMRMRSGEMDAVFTAGQALTRELLNEGMSKLKDTLSQMGMDVASLKVDDGQKRQPGGDSTPDRQANVRDNAPTESADASTPQAARVQHKMGADGWDVLV